MIDIIKGSALLKYYNCIGNVSLISFKKFSLEDKDVEAIVGYCKIEGNGKQYAFIHRYRFIKGGTRTLWVDNIEIDGHDIGYKVYENKPNEEVLLKYLGEIRWNAEALRYAKFGKIHMLFTEYSFNNEAWLSLTGKNTPMELVENANNILKYGYPSIKNPKTILVKK